MLGEDKKPKKPAKSKKKAGKSRSRSKKKKKAADDEEDDEEDEDEDEFVDEERDEKRWKALQDRMPPEVTTVDVNILLKYYFVLYLFIKLTCPAGME